MSWREMWEEYCELVAATVPIALGMATVTIVFFASISIVIAILRWLW